jgi:hypothetical protein
MTIIRVEKPISLTQYITIIERIRKSTGHTLWFRGCGKSSYLLKPSLYRYSKTKTIKELVETEYKILTRFKQRSIPFHNAPLNNDLETLFLMQHYGIPTRLLDWTENPFIALYFAVKSAKRNDYQSNAAVWILDPYLWTAHALTDKDAEIKSSNDSDVTRYTPQNKYSLMPEKALPIYGSHNSQRIVAQRGVFVIFGSEKSSMQKQYSKNTFPQDCLIKVILDKNNLPALLNSILESGITESVVFPDLDGLAEEIKRIFGFE